MLIFPSLGWAKSVSGIHFSYNDGDSFSLKDISFTVPKGNIIALVGPSGAGKSTLMDLLMRFYDVNDGAIRVDGTDIRDLKLKSLRQLISVVPQEVMLFNDTVAANIGYSRPEASPEELAQAAHQAYAEEFILQRKQAVLSMRWSPSP